MEPLATMASSTATVAPYLGLLTATVAKIVGALNTNIKQLRVGIHLPRLRQLDRICTAIAHGSVRCAFRAESRLANQSFWPA
jgi:hypothetical protein